MKIMSIFTASTLYKRAAVAILTLGMALPFQAQATKWGNEFEKTRLVPPFGKSIFFMGQDSTSLTNFKVDVLDVDKKFPQPFGTTLYNAPGINAVNNPLFQPTDFQAGENDFVKTLNEYGGGLAVGLFLSGCPDDNLVLRAIAKDESVEPELQELAEDWVDEMITYLKLSYRPVYLRIGYEFDGGWNCHDPAFYVPAFQNIKKRIDALRAYNVATVWQATTFPPLNVEPYDVTAPGHYDLWYPGDDYVDWIGLTIFYGEDFLENQFACYTGELAGTPREVQDQLVDYARTKKKPVMIAEAAPTAYDLNENTSACIFAEGEPWQNRTPVTPKEIWENWFAPFFAYIDANSDVIRAVAYINADWDSQPNWACTAEDACANLYWGDTRIETNPYILKKMKKELKKKKWLRGWKKPFFPFSAPDFSPVPGIYEAEYGFAPLGWIDIDGFGPLGLYTPNAENGRHVMLLDFAFPEEGPSIHARDVLPGNTVVVRYSSVDVGTEGGTVSLMINQEEVATEPTIISGSPDEYVEHVFTNLKIKYGDMVGLRMNAPTGVMWVDNFEILWD